MTGLSTTGASETPNTVHGRLLESAHISGYSFERACSELEWLLEGDRWRQLGYTDGAAFAESISNLFSDFRISVEQRKPLAKKLASIASQRAVAKVFDVDQKTISNDLREENSSANDKNNKKNNNDNSENEDNSSDAWFQRDADPSKLAKKQVKQEESRKERIANIAAISAGNQELGVSARYPIIYADPPWRYENPPIGASNRSIENHYPTMTLEEICALPVSELATDDAMLYLWATAPKLAECMKVIEAWGFEYRTNLVWDKEVIGMGYHARNQHELLLVARRGNIPPPEAGKQPSSLHRERRGEHSAKPDFYYEMIESAYPQLPKIELFCRSPREGWGAWGNQADSA